MAVNKKFTNALNALIEEKGLDREEFLEMLKESIAKAYKKIYLNADANVRVEISDATGKIRLFELRTVVEDVNDEDIEISIEEAKAINENYNVGDEVVTEADINEISRLTAVQTKQLFRQKIREAEKDKLFNDFAEKKFEMLTGIVDRVEPKFTIVNIDNGSGFLAENQQIPGEVLFEGQRIKVFVSDVDRNTKGTHIVISRTDPGLVKRLFESEVPEIADGTVEIKSISREAGQRTKIAVYSEDETIDAIGACVGNNGSRVKNVVSSINGEMIDIVNWNEDKRIFIKNALSPSDVVSVKLDEENRSAIAIVPDDQLSLAIGKRGQNARLAVRLTGVKIDIKSESEAQPEDFYIEPAIEEITIPSVEELEVEEIAENEVEEFVSAVESIKDESEVEEVDVISEELKEEAQEEPKITKVEVPAEPTEEDLALMEEMKQIKEKLLAAQNSDDDSKQEVVVNVISNDEDEDEDNEYDSKYDEDIDYDAYDEYYD